MVTANNYMFRPLTGHRHCGPGVDSASNRNEYQEYFLEGKGVRCVGLTTLPPLCGDCLEIWEPQPAGTLRACPSLYGDCFTYYEICANRLIHDDDAPLQISCLYCPTYIFSYKTARNCSDFLHLLTL